MLSSSIIEESSNEVDPALSRGVTIGNALPGAVTTVDPATTSTSTNRRTEETTNYEISRTVRQEVREMGGVKRLSVAVAVNAGATARSEAQMAQIASLVRSAVGFDQSRGDQIEVVEVAFCANRGGNASSGAPAAPVQL